MNKNVNDVTKSTVMCAGYNIVTCLFWLSIFNGLLFFPDILPGYSRHIPIYVHVIL